MAFRKLAMFLSAMACFAFSSQALAVISSTSAEFSDSTTEGTSSTSKSTKKIFASNDDKERAQVFVDHNFDRLQEEAARGSGVLLSDYVSLMGCKNPQNMSKAIQKNYQSLFKNGKASLIQQTERLMNNDSAFAQACETRS